MAVLKGVFLGMQRLKIIKYFGMFLNKFLCSQIRITNYH